MMAMESFEREPEKFWTNMFQNWDKYIFEFRQIYFRILTKTERQGGSAEAAVHTVSAGRPAAGQGTLFSY